MEPHGRDENQEDIIAGMIRGEEAVGDVTTEFLNNSGEGDESLNRGDGSGEVEADGWGEGELGGSDEGEADEGEADGSGGTNIANSGEVHIYIN
jgi:hypothetical protein